MKEKNLAGLSAIASRLGLNRRRKVKIKVMEWWQKMVFPVRRVWVAVAARVKTPNNGIHIDTATCVLTTQNTWIRDGYDMGLELESMDSWGGFRFGPRGVEPLDKDKYESIIIGEASDLVYREAKEVGEEMLFYTPTMQQTIQRALVHHRLKTQLEICRRALEIEASDVYFKSILANIVANASAESPSAWVRLSLNPFTLPNPLETSSVGSTPSVNSPYPKEDHNISMNVNPSA